MIVSKTPLRISFLGGGSDFREHFRRHGGAVLSAAIDKYVHVTVSPSHDGRVHVHYSRIEVVDCACQVEHDIVRAALEQAGIERGIEIHIIADLPGNGTGLGSSSALVVGLIKALYQYANIPVVSRGGVASDACDVEIDRLHKPIGEQDQWIATFGGVRLLKWNATQVVPCDALGQDIVSRLEESVLLFNTQMTRDAYQILSKQRGRVMENAVALRQLDALARFGYNLLSRLDVQQFAELLDTAWALKKQLAEGISNQAIDALYDVALSAGAWGGKICGAGGGGYLLIVADPLKHDAIREAVGLPELKVHLGVPSCQAVEI